MELQLDNNLQKTASYSIDTPPVAVHVSANSFIDVIGVGEIRPNQRDEGAFFQVNPQRPERFMFGALRYLRRPVDFIEIDLNNDQQNEVVVCEYGYLTGQLAWYEFKNKQWLRHILSDKPGAITRSIFISGPTLNGNKLTTMIKKNKVVNTSD